MTADAGEPVTAGNSLDRLAHRRQDLHFRLIFWPSLPAMLIVEDTYKIAITVQPISPKTWDSRLRGGPDGPAVVKKRVWLNLSQGT